jgi:hypothetical protein
VLTQQISALRVSCVLCMLSLLGVGTVHRFTTLHKPLIERINFTQHGATP